MYHISIYFDEKSTVYMRKLMEKVAKATGNYYMLEAQVPPHITLCALECADEEALKEQLASVFGRAQPGRTQCGEVQGSTLKLDGSRQTQIIPSTFTSGTLQWVSVGTFLPGVIFLQPVLNTYLQGLSELVHSCVQELDGVKIKPCYKPFSWLPHSTIAKKLTARELQVAFEVLQKEFSVFRGNVVRIGLAKMNPHKELASWEFE